MSIKTKLSTSFDSTKQTAFLTLNWTGNNDPGAWDYAALYGHKPRGTDDDCLTNQWVHTKARSSYEGAVSPVRQQMAAKITGPLTLLKINGLIRPFPRIITTSTGRGTQR